MKKFILHYWILTVILIIASFLRITDLGRESFWLDEAGVAIAASQATLSNALAIARSHVAAMPLDYIIAWLMGRISTDKSWLRLPEALWGIAGVWAVFFVTRKIFTEKVSFLITFLIAIAPTHIYLSQELRFYSSLFFFYWLLTGLLLHSLNHPHWLNWLLTIITAIIGSYFHIFTLLAFFNGGFFIIYKCFQGISIRDKVLGYLISGFIVGLIVLPGFLFFVPEQKLSYTFDWNIALSQIIIALGCFPIFSTRLGLLTGFLTFLLLLNGLWNTFHQHIKLVEALFISTIFQIGFVFLIDYLSGYFIAWRQLYFILPTSLMLVGIAFEKTATSLTPLIGKFRAGINYQNFNRFVAGLAFAGLSILTLWNFQDARQFTKSNAREITEQIVSKWHPDDSLLITPSFDTQLFEFYLEKNLIGERALSVMKGIDFISISNNLNKSGTVYLSTPALTSQSDFSSLSTLGFRLINNPTMPLWLWAKEN